MKKIILLSSLFILSLSCSSQIGKVASVDPTEYINTITAADLKTHLYIVASDEMEGRETGSAGQKKAGNYLIDQYKSNAVSFPKVVFWNYCFYSFNTVDCAIFLCPDMEYFRQ